MTLKRNYFLSREKLEKRYNLIVYYFHIQICTCTGIKIYPSWNKHNVKQFYIVILVYKRKLNLSMSSFIVCFQDRKMIILPISKLFPCWNTYNFLFQRDLRKDYIINSCSVYIENVNCFFTQTCHIKLWIIIRNSHFNFEFQISFLFFL